MFTIDTVKCVIDFDVLVYGLLGLGFIFAVFAMVVAGLIEIMRRNNAPSPGGYADESSRDNISPCHSVDDYNPYEYQLWESGQLVSYHFYF